MATVSELLDIAIDELGTKESPAGSNRTKYGAWFGLDGNPWCMMFVQWVFAKAGVSLPAKTASCTVLMNRAKSAGMWVTSGYRPGDVVIYDWGDDKVPDHCGIVEAFGGASMVAIEGNTAVGNDSDGGEVMRRTRNVSQILGAVRPKFDEEEDEVVTYKYLKDVPEKFRPIINQLMTAGVIQGDGRDPTGNGDVINLTHEQVRTLVFVYRGGGFDHKLRAAGLRPAVQ